MPIEQFFGRSAERAAMADDSGRWGTWVRAQPTLSQVGSAVALVDVVHDRNQPQAANELLLALVRVGSADGGVDESAATFAATLLAPGANRIIRTLTSLGPEVADIVAGQLWLQVRDYPWRGKPNAVAKNILMDTRRAVLRDYGASTHRRAALVPIPSPDDVDPRDHALERVTFEAQVPDLALLQLLVWATAWGILRPRRRGAAVGPGPGGRPGRRRPRPDPAARRQRRLLGGRQTVRRRSRDDRAPPPPSPRPRRFRAARGQRRLPRRLRHRPRRRRRYPRAHRGPR